MAITVEKLAEHYPSVYHVAERGALPQILRHGLLSSIAILDLVGMGGEERLTLEVRVRKEMEMLEHPKLGAFSLRDQRPLSEKKLAGCLEDGLTPEDWLALLNRKVFFWVSKDKVENLLGAREYKDREHLILQVNTRTLVDGHKDRITLSAMNTGTTSPYAHPRGLKTMLPLSKFPYEERVKKRLTPVVELCVDYAVPDIAAHLEKTYVGSNASGLIVRNDLLAD